VQGKVVPDFASDFLRQTELPCQCVKLVGQRHAFTLQHELAFANHMHQFDAGQDRARRSKRFETEHRPRDAFDRAVILLDNVVEWSRPYIPVPSALVNQGSLFSKHAWRQVL
jgi:hypothetical protein